MAPGSDLLNGKQLKDKVTLQVSEMEDLANQPEEKASQVEPDSSIETVRVLGIPRGVPDSQVEASIKEWAIKFNLKPKEIRMRTSSQGKHKGELYAMVDFSDMDGAQTFMQEVVKHKVSELFPGSQHKDWSNDKILVGIANKYKPCSDLDPSEVTMKAQAEGKAQSDASGVGAEPQKAAGASVDAEEATDTLSSYPTVLSPVQEVDDQSSSKAINPNLLKPDMMTESNVRFFLWQQKHIMDKLQELTAKVTPMFHEAPTFDQQRLSPKFENVIAFPHEIDVQFIKEGCQDLLEQLVRGSPAKIQYEGRFIKFDGPAASDVSDVVSQTLLNFRSFKRTVSCLSISVSSVRDALQGSQEVQGWTDTVQEYVLKVQAYLQDVAHYFQLQVATLFKPTDLPVKQLIAQRPSSNACHDLKEVEIAYQDQSEAQDAKWLLSREVHIQMEQIRNVRNQKHRVQELKQELQGWVPSQAPLFTLYIDGVHAPVIHVISIAHQQLRQYINRYVIQCVKKFFKEQKMKVSKVVAMLDDVFGVRSEWEQIPRKWVKQVQHVMLNTPFTGDPEQIFAKVVTMPQVDDDVPGKSDGHDQSSTSVPSRKVVSYISSDDKEQGNTEVLVQAEGSFPSLALARSSLMPLLASLLASPHVVLGMPSFQKEHLVDSIQERLKGTNRSLYKNIYLQLTLSGQPEHIRKVIQEHKFLVC